MLGLLDPAVVVFSAIFMKPDVIHLDAASIFVRHVRFRDRL